MSEKTFNRWFQLDLLGISFGILGCYFPGIHFGFYCMPELRMAYSAVCACLFAVNLYMQTHKDFLSTRWAMRRVILFAFTLGFGVSTWLSFGVPATLTNCHVHET
eukprot:m.97498 g.97498  ORF g.97498 m.97498 type:complete len:105 (-) comp14832_c0_seq1:150-464(-)